MQIATELEFDSIDRFAWKTFLQTRAGLRLFPKILESVPQLLASGDTNALLVRNGEVRGFSMAVQAALALADAPPKEAPSERTTYPNLTDDAAWGDGQSLTAPHKIPQA